MKPREFVIVSLSVFVLIVVPIVYDQYEKSLRRDYYEAVRAWRMYLDLQRRKDASEDTEFELAANKKIRDAQGIGGEYAVERARINAKADNDIRILKRREKQILAELNDPPPAEWRRFQETAKRAAMPMMLEGQ